MTAEEVPEFLRALREAFHRDLPDEDLARVRRVVEPERTLALRATAGASWRRRRSTRAG